MVQQDQTDATLVKQVRRGKRDCYRPLVDKYQKAVFHLACSMLNHTADAQDIAQEAFLTAYMNIHKLKDPAKFGSWLYGITRNLCRGAIRERKNEPGYMDPLSSPEMETEWDINIMTLNGADITDTLIDQLERLPEKYQNLLRLKYLQDYSYQDIATMLDIPVDLVRSRLFEGRKLLREHMETEAQQNTGKQNYA